MAIDWVSAATALKMLATAYPSDRAKVMIWTAARGQLQARADSVICNDRPHPPSIPVQFWNGLGIDGCAADWDIGHFMALIGTDRWQAFQMAFSFEGILELIPAERRASAVLSSSVAGDPAFVSASVARRLIYNEAGVNPVLAGAYILDKCRMGLVNGRAVQALLAYGTRPDNWDDHLREWDIPLWFWRDFSGDDHSSQNWELGTFAGRGFRSGQSLWVTLRGVAFAKAGLSLFAPSLLQTVESGEPVATPDRPRLSDAKLQQWWTAKAAVRESLTLEELLTLARAAFPDNHIARDRIRELSGDRKRGRKPIGG